MSLDEIKKSVERDDTNTLHRNAVKMTTKGRPSGGLIFFFKKNIKASVQFISDSIGILYLNKLAIVQVYLPYNIGEASQNVKFTDELILLEIKAEQILTEGYNPIILGDMNVDFIRAKENANVRKTIKMLYRLNLIPADLVFEQEYSYTFWMMRQNVKTTSWPDHVCVDKDMEGVLNVKLLGLKNNFGDHRAIGLQYEFNEDPRLT